MIKAFYQRGFADVLVLIGVVLVLLTIPVSVNLVGKRQELRKLAVYPEVSPPSEALCNEGETECNDSGGVNYCSEGKWYSREANPGECGKPPPSAGCPEGATESNDTGGVNFCKNGAWHSCPSGHTYENGECKAPEGPCIEGQTEVNNQGKLNFCRGGSWFSCPAGQEYKNGNCVEQTLLTKQNCLTDCQNLGLPDIACYEKCGLNFPSPTPSPTPTGPVKCPFKTKDDCQASGCTGTCDTCADGTVNCFTAPCIYSSQEECELSGCPARRGAFPGGCSRCHNGGFNCTQPLKQCDNGKTQTDSLGCTYSCQNSYWQKDDLNCECNFEGSMPSANYDPLVYVDMCSDKKIVSAQCLEGAIHTVKNKKDFSEIKCSSGKCHAGQCVPASNFCCENNTTVCDLFKDTEIVQKEKCVEGSGCIDGACVSSLPPSCKTTKFDDGCDYNCLPLLGLGGIITNLVFQKSDPNCNPVNPESFTCEDKDVYFNIRQINQGQTSVKKSYQKTCEFDCAYGQCISPADSPCNPTQPPEIDNNGKLIACIKDAANEQFTWKKIDFPLKITIPALTSKEIRILYNSLYKFYQTPLGRKIDTKELIVYNKVNNLLGFNDPTFRTIGGNNNPITKVATVEISYLSNYPGPDTPGVYHELAHGISDCGPACKKVVDEWKKQTGWTANPNPNNSGIVNLAPSDAPTDYAKTNATEDIAESIVLFITNPLKLQNVSQRRYDFIKKFWNDEQDAPDLIKR